MQSGKPQLTGTETGRIKGNTLNIIEFPKNKGSLKVTSIFLSVDGEVNPKGQGAWSVFLRLSNCSAGCSYCDTKYSWKDGDDLDVNYIIEKIKELGKGVKKITITGGEPMESYGSSMRELLKYLLAFDYFITVETNGLHDVKDLIQTASFMGKEGNLSFIMDWKLPSAGKVSAKVNHLHYVNLPDNCYVKFVISDRADFNVAIEAAAFIRTNSRAKIFFSPCGGGIEPPELFNWMKETICPSWNIGFNLQIHKYLFPGDWRDEEA